MPASDDQYSDDFESYADDSFESYHEAVDLLMKEEDEDKDRYADDSFEDYEDDTFEEYTDDASERELAQDGGEDQREFQSFPPAPRLSTTLQEDSNQRTLNVQGRAASQTELMPRLHFPDFHLETGQQATRAAREIEPADTTLATATSFVYSEMVEAMNRAPSARRHFRHEFQKADALKQGLIKRIRQRARQRPKPVRRGAPHNAPLPRILTARVMAQNLLHRLRTADPVSQLPATKVSNEVAETVYLSDAIRRVRGRNAADEMARPDFERLLDPWECIAELAASNRKIHAMFQGTDHGASDGGQRADEEPCDPPFTESDVHALVDSSYALRRAASTTLGVAFEGAASRPLSAQPSTPEVDVHTPGHVLQVMQESRELRERAAEMLLRECRPGVVHDDAGPSMGVGVEGLVGKELVEAMHRASRFPGHWRSTLGPLDYVDIATEATMEGEGAIRSSVVQEDVERLGGERPMTYEELVELKERSACLRAHTSLVLGPPPPTSELASNGKLCRVRSMHEADAGQAGAVANLSRGVITREREVAGVVAEGGPRLERAISFMEWGLVDVRDNAPNAGSQEPSVLVQPDALLSQLPGTVSDPYTLNTPPPVVQGENMASRRGNLRGVHSEGESGFVDPRITPVNMESADLNGGTMCVQGSRARQMEHESCALSDQQDDNCDFTNVRENRTSGIRGQCPSHGRSSAMRAMIEQVVRNPCAMESHHQHHARQDEAHAHMVERKPGRCRFDPSSKEPSPQGHSAAIIQARITNQNTQLAIKPDTLTPASGNMVHQGGLLFHSSHRTRLPGASGMLAVLARSAMV